MKITMIGHIYPQVGSYGLTRYIFSLAGEYIKMGHEVEMFVWDTGKIKSVAPWVKQIFSPKLYRGLTTMAYPFFLIPPVLKSHADVYHGDNAANGIPLVLTRKKPQVVTFHDISPIVHPEFAHPIITNFDKMAFWLTKNADAIICGSFHAREEILKYMDIPEEKVHPIHYGVDLDKFFPLKRKSDGKIRIGHLSGLGTHKNVPLLIDAFKILREEYENIELRIGGAGGIFHKLKEMAKGIPNIYFEGYVPWEQLNEFYNSLDIFVFPSLYEGFGIPPIEAQACGVPVLASNIASMPESVGDCGITIYPTLENMVKELRRLIEDENLRKELGKKGIKRTKQFEWENTAKKHIQVYESVFSH